MPMAVHLQGSHRDLTAVLHPTIAGGAKEQNICKILECYFKSQYEVKSYSLNWASMFAYNGAFSQLWIYKT